MTIYSFDLHHMGINHFPLLLGRRGGEEKKNKTKLEFDNPFQRRQYHNSVHQLQSILNLKDGQVTYIKDILNK